jgi:hypothetical protein
VVSRGIAGRKQERLKSENRHLHDTCTIFELISAQSSR